MTLHLEQLNAEPIIMDINKALDPGPGFGTEKIGSLTIDTQTELIVRSICID